MPTTQELLDEMGLSLKTVFVPFSQSRNKGEKSPSLNWKITVLKNGRGVFTTDYGAGCGHCPAYKKPAKFSNGNRDEYTTKKAIELECETGRPSKIIDTNSSFVMTDKHKPPITPETADVFYSLVTDADVIDYGDFEEWASNFGYDPDSRGAEKIYQACLEIALKLRSAIGDANLAKLRGHFHNY